MKKRIFTFICSLMLFFSIFISTAYATEFIQPSNQIYKAGIYQLNQNDKYTYNLMYQFTEKDKKSAIIVLDDNYDIVYKNVNCHRKCNAGTITNKNTIVVVGDSEVGLYFTKLD
ncbi:MAG: hypothetical protein DBY38_14410 [Clostridium cadaveris]|uniref:Uncharacterized protein n=1 Tax=Clostridium cadaveris TaxID=1529 RepID=A0A316LYT7_9CLOT|nr:MAG: hypothetical protein DBY38_14410 [Clostridium cadaveris]